MNLFGQDIAAVNIPGNLGYGAGASVSRMADVADVAEDGEERASGVSRVSDGLHALFDRVVYCLFSREAHSSSFMAVGSRPWLTVA